MTLEGQQALFAAGILTVAILSLWISRNIIWRNAGIGPWAKRAKGDMTGGRMGTMTINGRTFTGNTMTMMNGRIIVDGKDVTDDTGVDTKSILEVKITGDVGRVMSDVAVSVHGNVTGDVQAGGAVSCDNVGGSVSAAGSVSADDIKGNVTAGGSVSCDDVGGSVKAGGSVNHG